MKIRGKHLVCILMLLFFAAASQAYDVVLKNGKVVKGTVVSEDASLVVLQDADGLRINIKKTNIDVEKTQATNPPAKTVVSSQRKNLNSTSKGSQKNRLLGNRQKSYQKKIWKNCARNMILAKEPSMKTPMKNPQKGRKQSGRSGTCKR